MRCLRALSDLSSPEADIQNASKDELSLNQSPDLESIPIEVEQGLRENSIVGYDDWRRIDQEEVARGEALGKEPIVEQLPAQPGDVRQTCADTSRAEAELWYAPTTPFREGLDRFVAWFRSTARDRDADIRPREASPQWNRITQI